LHHLALRLYSGLADDNQDSALNVEYSVRWQYCYIYTTNASIKKDAK